MFKTNLLGAVAMVAQAPVAAAQTAPVHQAQLVKVVNSNIDQDKTGMQKLIDLSKENNFKGFGGRSSFAFSAKQKFTDLGNNKYHEDITLDKAGLINDLIQVNTKSNYRSDLLNKMDNPMLSFTDISLTHKVGNVLDEAGYPEIGSQFSYKNMTLEIKTKSGAQDQKYFLKDKTGIPASQHEPNWIFSLDPQAGATSIYENIWRDINYNMSPQIPINDFDSLTLSTDFEMTNNSGNLAPIDFRDAPANRPVNFDSLSYILWGTNDNPPKYNYNYPLVLLNQEEHVYTDYEFSLFRQLGTWGMGVDYINPKTGEKGSDTFTFQNQLIGDFTMVPSAHLSVEYYERGKTLIIKNVSGDLLEVTNIYWKVQGY